MRSAGQSCATLRMLRKRAMVERRDYGKINLARRS
jgi:hypothetical protein